MRRLAFLVWLFSAPAFAQAVVATEADTWLDDGARQLQQGHLKDGLALTLKAIESQELGPLNLAAAYSNLCMAYVQMSAYAEALKNCERALAIQPRDWRYLNNRATARLGLGELELAIVDLEEARASGFASPIVDYNLTIARERLRDRAGSR